ncbi:hypothetical protein ILUMI_26990, partial [Ignelater luminosus]
MKANESEECASAEKQSETVTENEKTSKKDASVSKISKLYKTKRNYSFSKRLKLGKSASSASITQSELVPCDISGPSSFPNLPVSTKNEDFAHDKSESDANLTETSWKTAESSEQTSSDSKSCTKSVISVENSKYLLSVQKFPILKPLERAKSLENMQKMPAYGDLIVDSSSTM